MKPLPKLDDMDAMVRRGRRSALMSARNDAAESLRDACVKIQSCDLDSLPVFATDAQTALDRLQDVARLWAGLNKYD
jgi:hypothetical protein